VPQKAKNIVLLFSSLVFYGWGEPKCILLMILATLVGYVNGLLQIRIKKSKIKKIVLALSLAVNILVLGFYKYFGFALDIVNGIFGTAFSGVDVALPIGISFYTFQIMSYSIDVYRKPELAEKNYFSLLTYVSMFPQLIAGPIVRYSTVKEELHNRTINFDGFCDGTKRFLFGLFKKVIIANNIGIVWSGISEGNFSTLSMASAWFGALLFSLQLYFDFSGYADMAIGMGKMLGFNFNENFNYPYSAVSVTDFWRRWHISLSFWFRDYVYIPLGGNRCSKARNIFNIFIVWTLTGLWHGASVNFVLWGMYYGILLILEKFVYGKRLEKLPTTAKHFYTLFIAVVGFVIFVFDDCGKLAEYMKIMFTGFGNIIDNQFMFCFKDNIVLLVVALVFSFPVYGKVKSYVNGIKNDSAKNCIYVLGGTAMLVLFAVSVAYLVSDTYNPFLYFRF
jgi:alginate O-acetyltransferase complex protein AlgI